MICTSGGVADLIAETAAISGDAISRRSGPQTARRHHTVLLDCWRGSSPSGATGHPRRAVEKP